jgi:hypothetical protein
MMQGLKGLGLSEEQLASLTPAQRKEMLAMTMRSDIVQKACDKPGVIAGDLHMEKDGLYGWRDVKTHVYLEMKLDKIEGGVQCIIQEETIHIKAVENEESLLQGTLFQLVDVEKSIWEVVDRKLTVTLMKATPMRWLSVLRD